MDVQEDGSPDEHLFFEGRLLDRVTYEVPLAMAGGQVAPGARGGLRPENELARRRPPPPGVNGRIGNFRPSSGSKPEETDAMPARILAFDASRGEESRVRMGPVTPMAAAPAHHHPGERDWPGDEIALHRFLSGDVLGFEQIVRYYSTMVFSLAARFVGPADAEDVVQETFLRAYHALEKFRGESSLKTWLYAIALNRARAAWGTLGRLRAMFVPGRSRGRPVRERSDDAVDPAASPEENAVLKERRGLRAAIRALPEEFRAARAPCATSRGFRTKKSLKCSGFRSIGTAGSLSRRAAARFKEKLVSARPSVPRLEGEELDLLISRSPRRQTSRRRISRSRDRPRERSCRPKAEGRAGRPRGGGRRPSQRPRRLFALSTSRNAGVREDCARRIDLQSIRFLPAAR